MPTSDFRPVAIQAGPEGEDRPCRSWKALDTENGKECDCVVRWWSEHATDWAVECGQKDRWTSDSEGTPIMKWVTRAGAKTDRVACPWLIKKFIDADAEFLFLPKEQVLEVARRERAKSFDAPGANYTHRDNKCSFEVLIEEFGLTDPALVELAKIVHGADIAADRNIVPEAPGLFAIAEGFFLTSPDDHEKLRLEFPLYDALYAWCRSRLGLPLSR